MVHRHTTSTDHQELERLADEQQLTQRPSDAAEELECHVIEAFSRLRPEERQILELKCADKGVLEIALDMNLTPGQVRRHVTRAYARLRRLLVRELQGRKCK